MSKDPGALNERPFVMVSPQGLSYVGLHKDEADCWQVALGWPSDDEIAARKTEGYAVYPATLTWQKASNTPPQVPEGFALLLERAQRLVEYADFKLAGVLSSESEVREIPSKAGSWVKARHLAALRDSVRALRDAVQAKEGGSHHERRM